MILPGLGWHIVLQNVYPYENELLDVFRVVESWIFTHGWIPGTFRIIVPCFLSLYLICYLWESYECSWCFPTKISSLWGPNFVYDTATWLGGELPSDSLIGDTGQGATISLWCSYFMWICELPNSYFWKRRSGKQKLVRLLLLAAQSHLSTIAIIFLVRNVNQPIYYWSISEWWNSEINLIPIGWFIHLVFMIIFEYVYLRMDIDLAVSYSDYYLIPRLKDYTNYRMIYFFVEASLCSTFIIPTYYAYWFGQIILVILFATHHMSHETLKRKEWRTFLAYISMYWYYHDPVMAHSGIASDLGHHPHPPPPIMVQQQQQQQSVQQYNTAPPPPPLQQIPMGIATSSQIQSQMPTYIPLPFSAPFMHRQLFYK